MSIQIPTIFVRSIPKKGLVRALCVIVCMAACMTGYPGSALAAEDASSIAVTLKDHVFTPANIQIPANTKVKLLIDNQDKSAEEFESAEMKREKMLPPGRTTTINIGPLKPGKYPFMGEFHPKTAQGTVTVE